MSERVALLVVTDLLARSRLEEAAKAEGIVVRTARRLAGVTEAPSIVVIDLDAPGALEDVREWRASHPDAAVTGFASHTDVETRRAAEALGVRVITRGQTATLARELFRG